MTPQHFAQKFGPACVLAMLRNGGYASVRLAQVALESAWGEATPKDVDTGKESFNVTGVKGTNGPAGYVRAWTKEWVDGRYVDELAEFRAYESYEQHILERDRIFQWDNYDAYRAAQTPEEAIHALAYAPMPYATDPDYEAKLLATLQANDFKRWDRYVFTDVPGDTWYAQDVREMRDVGILRGDDSGRLAFGTDDIRLIVLMNRLRKNLTN